MGDFTEVFFRHQFEGLIFAGGGLIHGGAYFRNLTVFHCTPVYQLDKTRQDKTFIIIILQVQFFGTQLARKR